MHLTRELDFPQACGFTRIKKVIMVYYLNPKTCTTMDYFFAKSKKPYFWGVFGHYPQNRIFSQKSGSLSFLPLRYPNFMRSLRKILWAILEKTHLPTDQSWHTDILTVVKWYDPFFTYRCIGSKNIVKIYKHVEKSFGSYFHTCQRIDTATPRALFK